MDPINDLEFICAQIETSIQILSSYYHGFAFTKGTENPKRLAKLVHEARTIIADKSNHGSRRVSRIDRLT